VFLGFRSGADLLANLVLEVTILFNLDQVLFALFFRARPRSAGYAVTGHIEACPLDELAQEVASSDD
jgi:hypothetical protein